MILHRITGFLMSMAAALPSGAADVAPAPDRLVFPAPAPGAAAVEYRLDPARVADHTLPARVDPERLATELMALLALPSRSCRETAYVAGARARIEAVAGSLGVRIHVDDLPERFRALPAARQRDLACDEGRRPPESGNLVAAIPGNPDLPSWNLSVHMDTNQVKFDGMRRDGDRILPAPGTPLGADDKAGMVIVLELLRLIAAGGVEHGPLHIVGLVAEEDGAAGARLIDAGAMAGDILVSIDGSDPDEVAHAAPTTFSGHVTVRTQTSHPAAIDDKKSVSACAVGADFMTRAGFRPDAHPPGHPDVVLHAYFVSCGIDQGRATAKGHPAADFQYNSISPYWTAAWQMRNLEGHAGAAAMAAELRTVLAQTCADAGRDRTFVACAITGTDNPSLTGYVLSADAPAVRLLAAGYGAAGMPVRTTTRQFGGFNGNHIKERFGKEMVLVGTGGDQAHTNQETVSVSGMAAVTRGLLAAMVESWRYRRVR
jgi:acetylornithine deacetylase/succinyl-diaminopimelate desuccinylase-like protein